MSFRSTANRSGQEARAQRGRGDGRGRSPTRRSCVPTRRSVKLLIMSILPVDCRLPSWAACKLACRERAGEARRWRASGSPQPRAVSATRSNRPFLLLFRGERLWRCAARTDALRKISGNGTAPRRDYADTASTRDIRIRKEFPRARNLDLSKALKYITRVIKLITLFIIYIYYIIFIIFYKSNVSSFQDSISETKSPKVKS